MIIERDQAGARHGQLVDDLFGAEGAITARWGSEPAMLPGTGLPDLIPHADELLATPLLRAPFITLHREGEVVPAGSYCRNEGFVNIAAPEPVIDPARLQALLAQGAAVKFNRVELWNPVLAHLADAIGVARAKKVKVWGFLSPHGQAMVPAHRDPAHVIACQVAGNKTWTLGGPAPATAWSGMRHPELIQQTTVRLEAGETLYLPYGYAHCAAAETASSFHVTFALEGTTAGELRHRVAQRLLRRLDGSDSTEVRTDNINRILDEVSAQLTELARELPALTDTNRQQIFAGDAEKAFDNPAAKKDEDTAPL